ncbi:hypothetical protein [Enterococcus lactis]|nr:hypothetical protein [Enterococcus lactis]
MKRLSNINLTAFAKRFLKIKLEISMRKISAGMQGLSPWNL